MKNNYDFWETYLKRIKNEIVELISKKKEVFVDMHIHSNYSSDGKQSLEEIIKSTKKLGFDIIAITDHDSLDVYDELYEIVKDKITTPIIIPGIEFTIDNSKYGNQCHLLQFMVNPKDITLNKNVEQNRIASFNRSKIQFKRLKENYAFQSILKENKIKVSYQEYIEFLELHNIIPEYITLAEYLMDKFKQKKITTFQFLDISEKYNELDKWINRKEIKAESYKGLREKYDFGLRKNDYNSRFLLSILAIKEVDDDWWGPPSSGSLSVNSYGQLKVEELNKKFITYFAHPSENKLDVVKKIINSNSNIVGVEINYRNKYNDINNIYKLIDMLNLKKIVGSDSHENNLEFYKDMNFYLIESGQVENIIC